MPSLIFTPRHCAERRIMFRQAYAIAYRDEMLSAIDTPPGQPPLLASSIAFSRFDSRRRQYTPFTLRCARMPMTQLTFERATIAG